MNNDNVRPAFAHFQLRLAACDWERRTKQGSH